MRAPFVLTAACALSLLAPTGCDKLLGKDGEEEEDGGKKKKKDDDGGDSKDEKKAGDDGPGENDMKVAEGGSGVDGPVPPEASMVFFAVEDAMLPLGCYDKDKKTLAGGKACLDMVEDGAEVRLASHDSQYNRKSTGRVVPDCLAGSNKKVALGAEGITGGADFFYASWPPSGIKIVKEVGKETMELNALTLSDDEKAKLAKAIPASGDVQAHQVAKIDLDGNDTPDKFLSVFIQDPKMAEQYKWSGAFFAPDGNLDDLTLIAKSKTKRDVFEIRGFLDLDGAGLSEIWVRLNFDEGAGDRLFQIDGKSAKGLGSWTCGADR